jgi:hypothetical protein
MSVGAATISVLLPTGEHLETLQRQECTSVELLTWEDAGWHERAATLASSRGWSHGRVESADEAVTCSMGEFLIVWTVFAADGDALDELLRAAREQPDARGSVASNFDPAILWRRDEFLAASGRRDGMAQARCQAMAHGATAPSWPSRPEADR